MFARLNKRYPLLTMMLCYRYHRVLRRRPYWCNVALTKMNQGQFISAHSPPPPKMFSCEFSAKPINGKLLISIIPRNLT